MSKTIKIQSVDKITGKARDKEYEVDDDGFLLDSGKRDQDWHDHAVKEEGLEELTNDHRKVMDHMASHKDKAGTLPTAAELSRATGMKIKYMHELFPNGPGRSCCKILGIQQEAGLVKGRLPRSDKDRAISKAQAQSQRLQGVARNE